jgi:hypothetical protein
MDKRKSATGIKASDFNKSHKELINSFVKTKDQAVVDRLQEQSNRSLKKIVKEKRRGRNGIEKNDIKVSNTNGGNFGDIDEFSKIDGIGKIKTISNKDFTSIVMGTKGDRDFPELNALMHNSKIKKGYVHYVNEDDPTKQKTIKHQYDSNKYKQDLGKVKRVQSFIDKKLGGSAVKSYSASSGSFSTISESDFANNFARLQESKEHAMVHAGIKSNNPFIRNMRRENRSSIEGMGHGWFGKTRKNRTPFGSSIRLGSYQSAMDYLKNTGPDFMNDSWGVDFETTGLIANEDSIIESAMRKGKRSHAFFAQKAAGFSLEQDAPFLHKSGFGKLAENINLNLSKPGAIPGFEAGLRGLGTNFSGTATASVVKKQELRQQMVNFVKEAKEANKPIFAMNARFEMNQADALFVGTNMANPLEYTEDYKEVARKVAKSNRNIWKSFKGRNTSNERAFEKLYGNQQEKFLQVLHDSKNASGKMVEIQEFGKMLNAASQKKGIALKTGRFGSNTNIDYLAKVFLSEGEPHEGILDLEQQEKVSKRALRTLRDIEGDNLDGKYTKKFIEQAQLDPFGQYSANMKKMISSELESNGDVSKLRNIDTLDVKGLNHKKMFDKALDEVYAEKRHTGKILESNGGLGTGSKNLRRARVGSLLFGGLLLGSAITNLFRFSGSDEDANTIEALRHGSPVQNDRRNNTSFGSGYRTQEFHKQEQEGLSKDEIPMTWKQLGMTGLGVTGAVAAFKHKASGSRLNDITYLGKLSDQVDNETLLGRSRATARDVAVAGVRRVENSIGGIGKAFGVGDLLSIGMYDSAQFTVDFTTKEGGTYAQFMDKILKRKLIDEGVDGIMFKAGELFERKDGKYIKSKGKFSLIKTVQNHDLSGNISGLAKSAAYQRGVKNTKALAQFPFLIIGGEGQHKAAGDFLDSFLHETFSKPMKLLADPAEALRQVFPDMDSGIIKGMKKILNPKYMPDIGLDGKELATSWTSMVKKHGVKLGVFSTLAYVGLGTMQWGSQKLAPDGTPMGDAGILGVGAYGIRKGHELYARFSDITGMTALRDYVDEKAPGSEGWQTTIGLTGAGALFGGLFGGLDDWAKEATSDNKYEQFIQNKGKTEAFQDPALKKIFKGKMTGTGKAIKTGGLIGFALALPFTIAGLGADTDAQTLAAEYAGEKEVAVRKGRFWETSFTPWEGGEIDYYRPNWYAKFMDNAKDKELNGGNISPFTEMYRAVTDPYWLEKQRYHDQPYPVTGPDGSMMGLFGPLYEASLGRIIKPVANMHESVYAEEVYDNTEYDVDAMARKQWNSTLEFIGLRGFAVKAMKSTVTGSGEIFEDNLEARSAKDIDSITRDFYDLQIGGGILTTEALRRVFQSQESFKKVEWDARRAGEMGSLNPAKNNMPSWMPGEDYVTDFKSGDPFMKVKDGYYRMPGEGYASRYEELKGVNPENYSDIHKYKILSDIGYGSTQHRIIKGKLQNRDLTMYEQDIFNEVERQVREKKESEINIRDPKTYDSMLGRYSAALTDLARSNPLETLLPISPAHKFLSPPDAGDYMDEKRFSREYRNWANPVDDFVLPTVSMTMNSLGIGGIDLTDDPDAYFDKVDFLKYSNLSREARASGDLAAADELTVMAQKTYTGKDLYGHHSNIAGSLPQGERKTFNYFVGADIITKQKMMDKVNPQYRDAYAAQYDKQLKEETERNRRISRSKQRRILKDIERRRSTMEARRKADIQDTKRQMPDSSWSGWKPEANTNRIKESYIENRARDYHGGRSRRARVSPLDAKAAEEMTASVKAEGSYSDHYSNLNKGGIQNALVVLRPGLDNGARVDIQVDRTQERNQKLREWGYIK